METTGKIIIAAATGIAIGVVIGNKMEKKLFSADGDDELNAGGKDKFISPETNHAKFLKTVVQILKSREHIAKKILQSYQGSTTYPTFSNVISMIYKDSAFLKRMVGHIIDGSFN